MARAAIVGGDTNVRTRESSRRQQLRGAARPLQHDDAAAARGQRLDDARKYRDPEAACDTDGRALTFQVEAVPERAQQVQFLTLMA
jgi:hypothetical protein